MDPSPPKPPVSPANPPPPRRGDEGPRWLSRPEIGGAAKNAAGAQAPAAGAPPVAAQAPGGLDATTVPPPNALAAHLKAGRWTTYALIGGVGLLAVSGVVAALLFTIRAPRDAASEARSLGAIPIPSVKPSAALSAAPFLPIVPIPPIAAVPTPSATPASAPVQAASPPVAADEGTLSTPPSAAGHRVFVDGHYAGDSPGPIKLHCGQHAVKIGSGGASQTVSVPCGGDVVVPLR